MLQTVTEALDSWDMTYSVVPPTKGVQIIEFGMSGLYTNYRCIISMDSGDDVFGVYYIMPMKIIPEQRSNVARYLAAVNYKVIIGHFDLDFRYDNWL